jgi:hypothetical protein
MAIPNLMAKNSFYYTHEAECTAPTRLNLNKTIACTREGGISSRSTFNITIGIRLNPDASGSRKKVRRKNGWVSKSSSLSL